MVTFTFSDLPILNLFVLFIWYVIPIKLDLFFCMVFILYSMAKSANLLSYIFSKLFSFWDLSYTSYCRCLLALYSGIGIFNSYKCKTPFKCVHSNFVVNLLLYKLITFMLVCCLHEILDYCDYFNKLLDCLLIFILIADNFAIQVFNLIIPVIAVYKSFKTKLLKISYFLQCCLILNYFIELSLNLLLQHGDTETNPGPRGNCSQYFSFCH